MSDNGMSRRDEIEMLLPFYDSGDLDAEERALVEDWLAADPDARAALDAMRAERAAAIAANDNIVPPADALQRFEQALDREVAAQRRPAAARPAAPVNWLERLVPAWLIPAPAAAMALSAVLIAALVGQTVYYNTRSGGIELAGGQASAVKGSRLIVIFKPGIPVGTLLETLKRADAVIVAGPRAGGLFEVVVRDRNAGTVASRVEALAADPAVQTLQRINRDETQ